MANLSDKGMDEGDTVSIEYNKDMIPRAKAMRKAMTKHEALLWYRFLKDYPIRFQRQKTIGSYIVDFFCHKAMLAIELDGSQHYEEKARGYDAARTAFLQSLGIDVLRFPNAAAERDFAGVCMTIDREVRKRMANRQDKHEA